jgi:hypothetical protein
MHTGDASHRHTVMMSILARHPHGLICIDAPHEHLLVGTGRTIDVKVAAIDPWQVHEIGLSHVGRHIIPHKPGTRVLIIKLGSVNVSHASTSEQRVPCCIGSLCPTCGYGRGLVRVAPSLVVRLHSTSFTLGTDRTGGTSRTSRATGTNITLRTGRTSGTNRTGRTSGTNRTGRTSGTSRTNRATGTNITLWTNRADRTNRTGGTDITLRTDGASGASGTNGTNGTSGTDRADITFSTHNTICGTGGTGRTDRTDRTSGTRRTRRTDRTRRALWAYGTRRTLKEIEERFYHIAVLAM